MVHDEPGQCLMLAIIVNVWHTSIISLPRRSGPQDYLFDFELLKLTHWLSHHYQNPEHPTVWNTRPKADMPVLISINRCKDTKFFLNNFFFSSFF